MTELPFVSICLLTYNRASILARSIESILGQTHRDFELIISDDRSPDKTEDVCRKYQAKDARIKYFKNEKNLRYAGNQNAALARASSDYVAIIHDGDIYRRDLIEQWVTVLSRNPSAALVFNAVEIMNLRGEVVDVFTHEYPELIPGRTLFDEMILRPSSPIFGIVMVRKSCVQTVGLFDETLPVLGDVDMWLRLLLRYDASYIREPLFQVAARELGHINRSGNWDVFDEYCRIYARNLYRRYSSGEPRLMEVRCHVLAMLERARRRALLSCAKRLKIKSFLEGLRFKVTTRFEGSAP